MTKDNSTMESMKLEIHSITIVSSIIPSIAGFPVPLPNWNPHVSLGDGLYSQRPGVFEIARKNSAGTSTLKVEVSLTNPGDHTSFTLTGTLDGIVFSGTFDKRGSRRQNRHRQTVEVTARDEPVNFKCITGEMKWTFSAGNGNIKTSPPQTRLEIYWIYGYPGKMYKRGVWVEVLRTLAVKIALEPGGKDVLVQRLINYLHDRTSLRYDVKNAAAHYTQAYSGGSFKLAAFLEEAYPLCNCYDQAGALQTFLGAMGIQAVYIYMNPFGFINAAGLIGWGAVNNPVFLDSGLPTLRLVTINSQQRTGFGNHSFCALKKNQDSLLEGIMDSTVGPYLGDNPRKVYVNRSIDKLTTLYETTPYLTRPGTVKDMYTCTGITDVQSIPPETGQCPGFSLDTSAAIDFKDRIGYKDILRDARKKRHRGVVCHWPSPLQCEVINQDRWKISLETFQGGANTAMKQWVLKWREEILSIEIYVCSPGSAAALDFLIRMLTSTQLPGIPFKRKENPTPGLRYWYFESQGTEILRNLNVVCRVQAYDSSIAVHPICSWLWTLAKTHAVKHLENYLPVIDQIKVNPPSRKIRIGEEITFRLRTQKKTGQDSLEPDFFFDGQSLQLVRQSPPQPQSAGEIVELVFRGRTPAKTIIRLLMVDRDTLLRSEPWPIRIMVTKT